MNLIKILKVYAVIKNGNKSGDSAAHSFAYINSGLEKSL